MHIITFLSLNREPSYLSLKMTQCQKFFVKSIKNRSKLFLYLEITAFKIVRMTKARIIMKRDVADLSKTYHNFSDTPLGAEIFEFK